MKHWLGCTIWLSYIYREFSEWKCQEKIKNVIACGYHEEIKPCVLIHFFCLFVCFFSIKYCIILKSKVLFLVLKKIEISVMVKLFQYRGLLFTVLCLSLNWKIHFNLDFVMVSFRCSKRNVWHVVLTTLQNEPTKLERKAGW